MSVAPFAGWDKHRLIWSRSGRGDTIVDIEFGPLGRNSRLAGGDNQIVTRRCWILDGQAIVVGRCVIPSLNNGYAAGVESDCNVGIDCYVKGACTSAPKICVVAITRGILCASRPPGVDAVVGVPVRTCGAWCVICSTGTLNPAPN